MYLLRFHKLIADELLHCLALRFGLCQKTLVMQQEAGNFLAQMLNFYAQIKLHREQYLVACQQSYDLWEMEILNLLFSQ